MKNRMIEEEIWKDVVGYEGLYKVSSLGNIYSILKSINLKPQNHKGYEKVNLYRNSKMSSKSVHRLIANAFIENTENKKCVNHIDFNRKNNRADNLEWCTHKENTAHSIGRILPVSLENINIFNAKGLNDKPVIQMDLSGNIINEFKSASKASIEMTGRVTATIFNHIRDKKTRKTAFGFTWAYKEV